MRNVLRVAAAAAAIALVAGPALAQKATMRISHQVPPAHHLSKMLEIFKAEAEKGSNGTVEVQILGASSAFKPAENHPAVARGSIEAALSVNFQWGNTIPEMNVVVIPYMFSDLERIKKFPGSPAAKVLEAKLEEKGVKNLAWFYITRQAIYTSGKKPIVALDDFKGLKIRGFNPLADEALKAVGAAPSAMAGDEVYQALQTGVLDAGVTDVSAAYSRKYYEVQKFGTVTPALTVYFHMYVNPQWWNGLKAEQRMALEAAARKAEAEAIAITEKTADDAIKQLQDKGMQLKIHNAQEAAAWKASMQKPVLDAFLKAAPKDGPRLIEALNKL
ncbi:MAG TPA: TRAP transporter substrate-binding protein DctP [Alphaproteobacteria bacterium]|jgi:C4-dicarboxylate-binding protein DctP|nr:TRAP transporter substrate-binding protein DctP [Alphaproteobacteria bacterium]